MSDRKTLTLRPVPYVDAAKIRRTEEIGFRFIERQKRYILQTRIVVYPAPTVGMPDHTWVDIPLVPEVYA